MTSEIDEKTAQSILDVCARADRMWVLSGSLRCRIMIVVYGLNVGIEFWSKLSTTGGSVAMIACPELRRVRDTKGNLSERAETVAGCEGKIIRYYYE